MKTGLRGKLALLVLASWLAGCATSPQSPVTLTPQEEFEPEVVPAPTMLVEYPPIEMVEPMPAASPDLNAPGANTVALASPSTVPRVALDRSTEPR